MTKAVLKSYRDTQIKRLVHRSCRGDKLAQAELERIDHGKMIRSIILPEGERITTMLVRS